MFEEGHVDDIIAFGDAHAVGEVTDRLRGITAAPQAGDGGHAWVVPAVDDLFLHQLEEFPFAHHRIAEVEAGELDLAGPAVAFGDLVEEPVVKGPVYLELEGADRVGDLFDIVGLAVGEVVHGIDAPLVTGAVVRLVEDTVHHGIAHVHVGRGHIYLCPQHLLAVLVFAVAHLAEEAQVLFRRAVAVGALEARLRGGAPLGGDDGGRLVVDIGFPFSDQHLGPFIQLVKIVGGITGIAFPLKAQPAYILHDRLDIFGLFLDGVGIVETEVAFAVIFLCQAKVEAYRFGMTDVEVAVGLGRKTGVYLPVVFPVADIFFDDRLNKIEGSLGLFLFRQLVLLVHDPVAFDCKTVRRCKNNRKKGRREGQNKIIID